VEKLVFQYQGENRPQDMTAPETTIALEPGTITVAPWQAAYVIQELDRGNRMSVGMRQLNLQERAVLYSTLQKEEAFDTWKVPGE
jgi:hypothetical protein